jgi:hypothetical protein
MSKVGKPRSRTIPKKPGTTPRPAPEPDPSREPAPGRAPDPGIQPEHEVVRKIMDDR